MSIRSVGELFESIMAQKGWSGVRLGRELGISQQYVSKIMRGDKDPIPDWLQEGLERVGYEMAFRPKREDDPTKRRTFLMGVGMTALSGNASPTFVPSAKVTPYGNPDFLRAVTAQLSHDLYERGGVSLVSVAVRHARKLETLRTSSDSALQSAGSELVRWAAHALCDARRFESAENAGRLALDLAYSARNPGLMACAFSVLTAVSLDRGEVASAMKYAEHGLRLPDITGYWRAWLNVRLSEARLLAGEYEYEARGAVEVARSILADAESFGLSPLRTGDLSGEVGIALSGLKMYDDAYAYLDDAAKLCEQSSPCLQGCYLGRRIETELRASEPDPYVAADRMFALAHVAPLVSSARLDNRIAAIYAQSEPWAKVPVMRDARKQLADIMPR